MSCNFVRMKFSYIYDEIKGAKLIDAYDVDVVNVSASL